MSQAGIIDVVGTHPQIPTIFVADVGSAIPIANTIELLGNAVTAHGVPLQTTASGNTVNFNVQYASAAASSIAGNAGVASFNNAQFTVDANGFVTLSGSAAAESFQVDAATAPGTNPVVPNGSGVVIVTGGQVAAGTTANVIRTNSLAANTYTIQIQRSQAAGASTVGDNGVCHFNSTFFTVDSNGFVSVNGSGLGETITGTVGGALSPTAGNWNILASSVAAGTTPIQTSGSVSTLTIQVQRAQAIGATNASNVGLAAFNSTYFTVDSNGFVSVSGTGLGQTITGQSGGALSPTAGNWNIFGGTSSAGTSPVVTSGSGSTLTTNVQISQALAAADATKIGLSNFDSASFAVSATGFVTLLGSGGFVWNDVSGAFSPLKNNGYFITGTATGTLPVSPSQGDTIKFLVDHASQVLTIQANTGQKIRIGSIQSSSAGTAVSTLQGDSLELTYRTSDTTWMAIGGALGTWTLA